MRRQTPARFSPIEPKFIHYEEWTKKSTDSPRSSNFHPISLYFDSPFPLFPPPSSNLSAVKEFNHSSPLLHFYLSSDLPYFVLLGWNHPIHSVRFSPFPSYEKMLQALHFAPELNYLSLEWLILSHLISQFDQFCDSDQLSFPLITKVISYLKEKSGSYYICLSQQLQLGHVRLIEIRFSKVS